MELNLFTIRFIGTVSIIMQFIGKRLFLSNNIINIIGGKQLCLIIVFMMQIMLNQTAFAQLVNSGFETVTPGSANGWTDYQANNWNVWKAVGSPTVTVDFNIHFAGAKSAKITASASAKAVITQTVSVSEGYTYKLEGKLKTQSVSTGAFTRLNFQKSDGTGTQFYSTNIINTQDWTTTSITAQAPKGSVSVKIEMYFNTGTGTAWFDDFSFLRVDSAHPFLIVQDTEYETLQARAGIQPWADMKTDAATYSALTVDPEDIIQNQCVRVGTIASASALSYILDPPNRATYVTRIVNMVNYFDTNITPYLSSTSWEYAVPESGAFFNLVLAVDIVNFELSASGQLTDIENKLAMVYNWYNTNTISWLNAKYGACGLWGLYKNYSEIIDYYKTQYKTQLLSEMTNYGVSNDGPMYAAGRYAPNPVERDAKAYFMDVLEYTGTDNTYYNNTILQSFYEWMYGYAQTPVYRHYGIGDYKDSACFGDSCSVGGTMPVSARTYSAYRFGTQAGKYASWGVSGSSPSLKPQGQLLYYILMGQSMLAAENPKGKIYSNGGAWFLENNNSNYALSSGLWNESADYTGHRHKDTNAIHLTAYGEHLLKNSGYNGWANGYGNFTWDYISNYAKSSNTVTIDNQNHQYKYGGGITEGFIGPGYLLAYASGNSGNALPNGSHVRNEVFVAPADGKNGYWILFDEVQGNAGTTQANMALHPNSDATAAVAVAKQEYKYTVGGSYPRTISHPVYLTIFYGTAPNVVTEYNGALCAFTESITGKYLLADYTLSSLKKHMVTVLYPHDATHAKATMTRISGTSCTGVSIADGLIVDYALESENVTTANYSGVYFKGLSTFYRKNNGSVTHYFVRKGTGYNDGGAIRKGFSSAADVSLEMNGAYGRVISSGCLITLYYPGVLGVKINNSPVTPTARGTNWVQFNLVSGTSSVELTF